MINENNTSVYYSGDETNVRKKECGVSLIEQVKISITSLRNNWSQEVPIYFVHTKKISDKSRNFFQKMGVSLIHIPDEPIKDYKLANKLLVSECPNQREYRLFLDCDTFIHKVISIRNVVDSDILVALDALQGINENELKSVFRLFNLCFPVEAHVSKHPAYDYYVNNITEQIPMWNSGVFLLKESMVLEFYSSWLDITRKLYKKKEELGWSFYIEQVSFCLAVFQSNVQYGLLPKGYNFIATPRAPMLLNWPRDQITIEHYAGVDTPINKEWLELLNN